MKIHCCLPPIRVHSRDSRAVCFCVAFTSGLLFAQPAPPAKGPSLDSQYVPGGDSRLQPDVPKGSIFHFTHEQSKIFPGTTRTITVYAPAQYKADRPACV